MASTPRPRFSWRVFTTFSITLCFAVLLTSGLVLYVAPPGRIANWSHWTLGLLTKAQWQAIHTVFALVFLAAAATHLFFNWRALLAYLRSRVTSGLHGRTELVASSVTLGLALVATLAGLAPFSTLMEVGERAKNSWTSASDEPPVPHAEELTIARLGETLGQPPETLLAVLRTRGVAVDTETQTLGAIASSVGRTPQELYRDIRAAMPDARPTLTEGGGYGRRTVEEVCEQFSVPLEVGVQRLRDRGIGATGSTSVRQIADSEGLTPMDVARMLVEGAP